MQRKALFISLGLILSIVIAAIFIFPSNSKKPQKPGDSLQPEENMQNQGDSMNNQGETTDNIREIEVRGNEYSYTPNTISVSKGERVRIVFVNEGRLSHNLVIGDLGLATKIVSPGDSDSIEFSSEEDGMYTFYCSVGNHRNLGMEGNLQVE